VAKIKSASVPNPKSDIDLDEARRFLAALDPGTKEFAFHTHDDWPKHGEKNAKLASEQYGTLASVTKWLVNANDRGAGVFVALNPTDGHGRKKENVTGVRALMLDLDEGKPLDPVKACELPPHIIIETSPGNHHCFWLVKGFPLKQFADRIRGLAARFDGDPTIATLERCTRLAGFFWRKDPDSPHLVRIVEINDREPYSADELKAEFPPQKKPHKAPGSLLVLPPGAPVVAAEEFVKRCHTAGENLLLRHYRGAFYLWTGTHYCEHPDEALERDI
jgi:RepB DNA-primase N-terminal domain